MKRKVRPNVVSGGTAINLGNNLYYMRGKTHKQGGIDIGSNPKTGIEVENGEVVQASPTGLRVFSAQPILNGISPANALLMGGNPNNIFNAQEAWKQANHYNDDGTKFESGGYTPSKEIIDYIKKTEGFRDKWYKDGNGIDTIGYGFTGSRIKKLYPNGITREQADKEFADSIAKRALILAKDTPNWNKLSQSQRDALLSYHYNVGEGSYRNKHKKLQQALIDSDWENVVLNMDAGYNDKKNPGLRKRRDYERELFRSGMVASLTGDEEKAFRDWYDRYSRSQNLDPNPDAKEHFYDYRTYWKNRTEQQKNDEWKLGNHLPDTYKMPGHPTFSVESIYSTRKTPGGTWKQVGLGPVYDEQFVDSKYTRRLKTYKNVSFELGGTHTVQKGDTLTGIAKKYNIPYSQLLSYNRDIANPNVIRIGQSINLKDNSEQSKPQIRNIREYYEQEAKLNLDNVSAIQGAKHKQNYAIIDKDSRTIKVYDINNNLLYESNQINTGKANTDYNTVTYSGKNGKLLYGQGNNSTPAGITVISSKGNYHGNPSFQRARVDGNGNMRLTKEGLPDNIASSIHWEKGIAGPNASNGCVRADSKTLQELNKYLDVGSMVYTLPQQHGSSFQLRDGRLNFVDNRTQNERNKDELFRKQTRRLSDGRIASRKYERDINTVYNGTYLPIGIEDTLTEQRQNPNRIKAILEDLYFSPGRQAVERDEANGISRFQEVKSRNRKEYADSIVNNKEAIMKAIPGLSNKEYNQLITMALGIPERETHYGTDIKQIATNLMSDSILSLTRKVKGQKDTVRSIGIGKIKSAADNEEMRNIYSALGINYTDKNMSAEDSAKMVMSKLAYTYLNEIKGRTFVDANGNALTPEQALYYAYTGNKKKKIRDNFYQYEKNYPKEHYNDIMNYGKEFNITQQFKYGGDDKGNNKFAVRDNTKTKFVPQIGYLPTNKDIISINRSNKTIDDGITGFIPGIGDVIQGGQALIDLSEKNYRRAGLMAGLLFVPNILEKPIKLARKYIKAGKAVYNSRKILNKYDKLLSSNNPIVKNNAEKIIEFGDRNIDDIRGLSYYANEDDFIKMKRKGSNIKTVYPGSKSFANSKLIERYDNPLAAETFLNSELEKAALRENPTNKIINKIIDDTKRLKSGRRVALIDDYSLSGDSYPLYERVLERNARKDVGKIDIVTDDNIIRMIELNKDAVKSNWKQNVDKSIQSLRDYTGNQNIPDRFTIFGKTYVPAFQLEHFKYGGIHIKPSKRGTFTAAAKRHHMGVQEFARTVLNNRARYSAAMVKKANFARNASKWHKKELGGDMTKQYYITKDNIYSLGGNVRPKAQLGIKYVVDENGRIVPVNIPNTDINITNLGEINKLLDPVTVTDSSPKTPNIIGKAEVFPKIKQSVVAPNSHRIERHLPISIQDIVNPITSSKDATLSKPDFNSTILAAFPNPNYNPKQGSLITKSSVGATPKNSYYSKFNIGLHKVGNYIKNNPDLLGLGINLTGNLAASLINRSAIKGMKYVPAPIPISAQKLPTEVNIEPQVSSIRENVAGQERLIADNTADSRVALARRQRVRNQGAQQYQTLFGNKLNTELQLLTADRLNRQGVDAQNVTQYNQWRRGLYDFENRRREMLSENAVAGINNAAEAIAGERGYLARREARKRDLLNMGLIAATSPNAQNVIGSKEFEEFLNKIGYDGKFSLLRKRING